MADAGIAIWESKYFYQFWRPITGIRESDPGTGPTGLGDGNPSTLGDPDFYAARRAGEQPAGAELHAAVPGVPVGARDVRRRALRDAAQLLRHGRRSPFTFVSDEFNGVTRDNEGNVAAAEAAELQHRSRRPRRRTARAGSTSASTGRSTRPRASRRAEGSRTGCSREPSRRSVSPIGSRRARSRARARPRPAAARRARCGSPVRRAATPPRRARAARRARPPPAARLPA